MQDQSIETKYSSIHFPIIPPLPSSALLVEKNAAESLFLTGETKPKLTPPSSFRLPFSDSTRQKESNTSPGLLSSRIHENRILKTAETIESLFCLSSKSRQEHRNICEGITDGTFADDVKKWCCALKVSMEEVITSQQSSNPIAISHLIRLLRRAKSRFSLVDPKWRVYEDDVLFIWLSYSEIQGKYISSEEARATYRFIQNQGFGLKKSAFYLSLAEFESRFNKIRPSEILMNGIKNGAQPVSELHIALGKGFEEAQNPSSTLSVIKDESPRLVPPLTSVAAMSRKRVKNQNISPKRQKILNQRSVRYDESAASPQLVGVVSLEGTKNKENCPKSSNLLTKKIETGVNFPDNEVKFFPKKELSFKSWRKESSLLHRTEDSSLSNQKSKALVLPKIPRLKSIGLSGGAKRLSPEDKIEMNESGDDEEENTTFQMISSKGKTSSSSNREEKKGINKIDLSYMMNWDPKKRGLLTTEKSDNNANAVTREVAKSKEAESIKALHITRVESKVNTNNVVTTTSQVTSTLSAHSGKGHYTNENGGSNALEGANRSYKGSEDSRCSSSGDKASLLAQCNTDFLPLVYQKNILKVNNSSYVKLGVMGKGGSSKVYRSLSKDCSVVAIKKVKLAHLDEQAIDGYANEIALLKKLRGNPAIIQMYDSEVDLGRKAIFLVMEIGEVDLNCVLQKEALYSHSKTNTKKHSLNINFIRLTWQQMLSAVHSIHEERIIHGDLKPANFLFVRGTLKLIDFGIAKAIQNDDTNNIYRDSQIGTLNYMSPEAILDNGSENGELRMKISRASDIWSLGCILYQMVYGRTPFASLHMIQKLQAIINPAFQIKFPSNAPDGAVDAIKQCLRRSPENRPPIIGKNGLLNEHSFLNA